MAKENKCEFVKDTVRNSVVKNFYFIGSVMEALKVFRAGE